MLLLNAAPQDTFWLMHKKHSELITEANLAIERTKAEITAPRKGLKLNKKIIAQEWAKLKKQREELRNLEILHLPQIFSALPTVKKLNYLKHLFASVDVRRIYWFWFGRTFLAEINC